MPKFDLTISELESLDAPDDDLIFWDVFPVVVGGGLLLALAIT